VAIRNRPRALDYSNAMLDCHLHVFRSGEAPGIRTASFRKTREDFLLDNDEFSGSILCNCVPGHLTIIEANQALLAIGAKAAPQRECGRWTQEKMDYFAIEPEVAGGWGKNTIADRTVHPPRIIYLHYEFDGWLGDDIVESAPCFLVSERLANLLSGNLTGYGLAEVEVSTSEEFRDLNPHLHLPTFHWLQLTGAAGKDDFGLAQDLRCVVSGNALVVLRQANISHCEIERWEGPTTGGTVRR